MTCAVHEDTESAGACASCKRPLCDACLTHHVEGEPTCADCTARAEERARSLGGLVIAVTAATYVVLLALTARTTPVLRLLASGMAAIIAIGLGRILQIVLRVPPQVARRHPSGAARVDAAGPAR